MNFVINRLDNLILSGKSYEFIPDNIKRELNIEGKIVGANDKYIFNEIDIMFLIKNSDLRNQIGINMYNALLRKPMMIFLIPTQQDEFMSTKEQLDQQYGIKSIHLNNFAQAFSLGCWFTKDSCINANVIYWMNGINGYNMQEKRDMQITMSDGSVSGVELTDNEFSEAIARMYEIYKYLLPEESKMGKIEHNYSLGTMVWNIDKAISTEGKSFARGLMLLQEARRTGVISSKIDKYCSVLECLYAINKEHKKNISNITAAYIGHDDSEREKIRQNIRAAYGVRSDSSHGDNLKYLRENDKESLQELAIAVDDYVRRVFRKTISNQNLNYSADSETKVNVREYFRELMKSVYPE